MPRVIARLAVGSRAALEDEDRDLKDSGDRLQASCFSHYVLNGAIMESAADWCKAKIISENTGRRYYFARFPACIVGPLARPSHLDRQQESRPLPARAPARLSISSF